MALGEKSDLGLGQETYKISLEYIVVAEGKKVLKKKKNGGISKRNRSQLKTFLMTKAGKV